MPKPIAEAIEDLQSHCQFMADRQDRYLVAFKIALDFINHGPFDSVSRAQKIRGIRNAIQDY